MEYLPNGFTLELAPGTFPLSTDSMVLSDFVKNANGARILDLGSGCGTLGLLLCAKNAGCTVTGIELDEHAHAAATENIRRNGLQVRLNSICTDLRNLPAELTGRFHCCISNPPYFTGGPASQTHQTARREDTCAPEDLFAAVSHVLKFGGDFYLVHKPERLAELFAAACKHKLEPKRLRLLRHKENGPVALVLVQCRKDAKPGLVWEEASLHDQNGDPTAYYRQVYHTEA